MAFEGRTGTDMSGHLGGKELTVLVPAVVRLAFHVQDDPTRLGVTVRGTVADDGKRVGTVPGIGASRGRAGEAEGDEERGRDGTHGACLRFLRTERGGVIMAGRRPFVKRAATLA
jgi:hypothetical protein